MPDAQSLSLNKVKPRRFPEMLKEPKEHQPSVHFDLEVLPEARKWEIGKTYRVVMDIKQTSINESDYGGGAGFDIMGIKVVEKKKKESKDNY